MRVLVTGGGGYLGHGIVKALQDDNRVTEVRVVDNFQQNNFTLLSSSVLGSTTSVTHADILDDYSMERSMTRVDAVIHLAALTPGSSLGSRPHQFEQVNHWGSAAIAALVEKLSIARIINVSSAAVYGFHANHRTGTDELPTDPYGWSKLHGERHFDRLKDLGHRVATLRLGTVHGINEATRFDTFVNAFLKNVRLRQPLIVFGDGSEKRPILSLEYAIYAIEQALFDDSLNGTMTCFEETVSILDTVRLIQEIDPSVSVSLSDYRPPLLSLKVPDTLRLMPDFRGPSLGERLSQSLDELGARAPG